MAAGEKLFVVAALKPASELLMDLLAIWGGGGGGVIAAIATVAVPVKVSSMGSDSDSRMGR